MAWRASLPMYNLPDMQAANAGFWAALRTELGRAGVTGLPETLEFGRKPVPGAIEPETLFTQVCGWPLQTIFAGQAVLLGMPVYTAAGCHGATHSGVFIVGVDSSYATLADLRGCRFVFNSLHSNSGMNLPRREIAELAGGRPFFGSIAETHSQPGNIERVARGEADATCVDGVTYAFFQRHRPALAARTRVLAATRPTPSIPFVTSAATPVPLVETLRAALLLVGSAAEWATARQGLLLAGILPADPDLYRGQCGLPGEAAALGYPNLA